MVSSVLFLQELNVHRSLSHIVRDVSFGVDEGEIMCLVGGNGAGKSTVINAIIGLLPPTSGSIKFKGVEIAGKPAHEIAQLGVGYAPEDRKIFTDLTVYENILIPLKYSKPKERTFTIERIFSIFPQLASLRERKGLYLSGGEQKMLAVARALALSPQLILLDEPLEGLAPIVVESFVKSIKEIKTAGVSMIIAESNLRNALKLADRLCAIERGEIKWRGKAEEVNEQVYKILRG